MCKEKKMRRVAAVLACLVTGFALTLLAQEGHPLTGTWHGDYGTSPTQRTPIVFLMHLDSNKVEGNVNPCAISVPLNIATLDASKWGVHIEADVKDASGKLMPMVFDGKLDNVGSYNRTITGTWTSGAQKGEFKLTRD
jgi:hypothetical protein